MLTGSILGHPQLEEQNREVLMQWLSADPTVKLPAMRMLGLSPAKITKLNARHMLRSLSEIIHLGGFDGLLVLADDMEALVSQSSEVRYTKMKRDDTYESVRQLIDDIDSMSYVIEAKHELDNLAELFPGNEEPMLTVIEMLTEARQLNPLTNEEIKNVFSQIIDFHGRAYNWQPQCSAEELMEVSKSGGYLLRTKIRTAIEYMDELYQYGDGAISAISKLEKESFEEEPVSLEDLEFEE